MGKHGRFREQPIPVINVNMDAHLPIWLVSSSERKSSRDEKMSRNFSTIAMRSSSFVLLCRWYTPSSSHLAQQVGHTKTIPNCETLSRLCLSPLRPVHHPGSDARRVDRQWEISARNINPRAVIARTESSERMQNLQLLVHSPSSIRVWSQLHRLIYSFQGRCELV